MHSHDPSAYKVKLETIRSSRPDLSLNGQLEVSLGYLQGGKQEREKEEAKEKFHCKFTCNEIQTRVTKPWPLGQMHHFIKAI